MKKLMPILVSALLAIAPASALADTLSIDLDTATYDELADARDQITARMDELLAAQATPAPAEATDGVHYSGEGTTILSDVQLPYDYNVLTYTASRGTGYKLMGDGDKQLSYCSGQQQCDIVSGPNTAKLLVEGKDAWTMDVEPLVSASALTAAEGVGCYTSPIFPLETDSIISLHVVDPDGKYEFQDALSIDCTLYILMGDGKLRSDKLVIGASMTEECTYDADLILSPIDGAAGYVLVVNVLPTYEWSATLK